MVCFEDKAKGKKFAAILHRLKDARYGTRSSSEGALNGYCFKCHQDEKYVRLNPHQAMLGKDGKVNEQACLFCHKEVIKVDGAAAVEDFAATPTAVEVEDTRWMRLTGLVT